MRVRCDAVDYEPAKRIRHSRNVFGDLCLVPVIELGVCRLVLKHLGFSYALDDERLNGSERGELFKEICHIAECFVTPNE